ncbi:hypothetical protein [Kitasatospora sp. NPDC004531]
MRGRIATAVAAAAVLLTGCTATSDGPAPAPSLITAAPEARPATGDNARRAAEVAAAWPGSAAQQAWEKGYFPLGNTTEWLPRNAFRDEPDKAAYEGSRFDLQTTLPVSVSGTAEVQFADGSRLTLPQRSAKDTLTWLTGRPDPCRGECGGSRLSITAVQPGTTTVTTSRGQATIPVWEFTVAGYDEPFRYPAVLAQGPDRPAPGPYTQPVLRSVSPDGLILTALVEHGACDAIQPGEVHETDRAVVLIPPRITPVPPKGGACTDIALMTPVEFRLSHPLGPRTVLGFTDGLPQLPRER